MLIIKRRDLSPRRSNTLSHVTAYNNLNSPAFSMPNGIFGVLAFFLVSSVGCLAIGSGSLELSMPAIIALVLFRSGVGFILRFLYGLILSSVYNFCLRKFCKKKPVSLGNLSNTAWKLSPFALGMAYGIFAVIFFMPIFIIELIEAFFGESAKEILLCLILITLCTLCLKISKPQKKF